MTHKIISAAVFSILRGGRGQSIISRRALTARRMCNITWRECWWVVIGSSPEGVAVDATAKLLFYTDNGRNTINIARTENSRDHAVLISYAKHPRTIQIDPMNRFAPRGVTYCHFYWNIDDKLTTRNGHSMERIPPPRLNSPLSFSQPLFTIKISRVTIIPHNVQGLWLGPHLTSPPSFFSPT